MDAVEVQIRELLRETPTMLTTVIAERIGWERGMTVLKDRVRDLRPAYVPGDPVSRTTYRPGELAQCDLWFPEADIPLGYGQSGRPPVLVMVSGYSRVIAARMLPSRTTGDLIDGHTKSARSQQASTSRPPLRFGLRWDSPPRACLANPTLSEPVANLLVMSWDSILDELVDEEALEWCQHCYDDYLRKERGRAKGHCLRCSVAYRQAKRYGLTIARMNAILRVQDDACALCGELSGDDGIEGISFWHVDHDHACCNLSGSCGRCVRGLLCKSCNMRGVAWYERLSAERRDWPRMNAYLADPLTNVRKRE